ncbi:MAG: ankyrin repeat domain-containing protein [Candidatus Peribacteria bacterium]|nr:MAG: ankyrin repeat domain-containing protein [Candidatus Peribacteria bacterium]
MPLGDDQWTLLQAASYRGYIDAIKLLIDNGADLNYPSFTPLMLAIIRGGR